MRGAKTNGEQADMRGKIVMITGASAGIGKYTAQALFRQGAKVYLACRSEEKTRRVIEEIKSNVTRRNYEGGSLNFIKLDLNDLESVRECAREFIQSGQVLDVLINNAGCAILDERYSKQGYEEMFQSNTLGHHLLIELLWNNMNSNPNGSRVVILSSFAHMFIKDGEFYDSEKKAYTLLNRIRKPVKPFSRFALIGQNKQYGLTKLCNIYQAYYFNDKVKNTPNCKITVNACHPGAVKTEITREVPFGLRWITGIMQFLFFIDMGQGSQNTLHLACSKDVEGISGKFFDQCRVTEPLPITKNKALQQEFADFCEEVCKSYTL